jgi:hypothetical protein
MSTMPLWGLDKNAYGQSKPEDVHVKISGVGESSHPKEFPGIYRNRAGSGPQSRVADAQGLCRQAAWIAGAGGFQTA